MQKKSKNRRFCQKTGKNNIRGKQEGITLVALAITIIVLLILASITIGTISRRQWNIK